MELIPLHKYRDDIDGLRSIAVLTVVAFHLKINKLAPGGFIGVDVFFVISGYLISGFIFKDVNNKNFSIKEFYVRRARRIFPALFVVYIACLIGSLATDFPSDSEKVGRTMMASLLFSSNVYFYGLSGYFSGSLENNPLLHTWSLSVEEQFYVLFPLLIFVIRRLQHRTQLTIISVFTVASFGSSVFSVFNEAAAAFYLLHNRAWELFIGAGLAVASFPLAGKRWHLEFLAATGLLLIVGSNFLLSPASLFPGPSALAACLGTALLIYSGETNRTVLSRILSAAPLRFIGLISYSLYLWHWPIIVFVGRFHYLRGVVDKSAILAASILVAYWSWRFIEKPFREKPFKLSSSATLRLSGALMFGTGVIAIILGPVNRMIWHTPMKIDDLLAFEDYSTKKTMRDGSCFLTAEYNKFSMFERDKCMRISSTKPNYLIVGDSHAAHLWAGFHDAYPGINFLQATASGCRPLLELKGSKRCTDLMKYVFDEFLPSHHLDGVILSGRWETEEVEAALKTSAVLAKHAGKIIISGPIQEYRQALPRILALAVAKDQDYKEFAAKQRRSERQLIDEAFASSKLPERVIYVSAYQSVNTLECNLIIQDRIPVQFDYGHLTREGSVCVARKLGASLFNSTHKPVSE